MAIEEMTEIKAGDMTEEQARILGRRVARLLATVILGDLDIRLTVTKIFEQLESTEGVVFDAGYSEFVSELVCLTELTKDGMYARLDASSEEASNAIETRKQVIEFAEKVIEKGDTSSLSIIEGMIRAANESENIAKGLYAPIKQNLENLVATGHHASVVSQLQKSKASERQDQMHDSKCNNPNCEAHTNH